MTPHLGWNGTGETRINGIPVQQNEVAAPLWEVFFRTALKRYRVVEIGTGTGGFTRHLARFASHIITFDTVDRWYRRDVLDNTPDPSLCPISRQIEDVFAVEKGIAASIKGTDPLVQPYANLPVILICDGGNKPREVQTFARYLKSGDVLAVHDYASLTMDKQFWEIGRASCRERVSSPV